MSVRDIIIGVCVILLFSTLISWFIYNNDSNYKVIIPKYNPSNNAENIQRLENIIKNLNNEIKSGKINIEFLSTQKKTVETHLNALKIEESNNVP